VLRTQTEIQMKRAYINSLEGHCSLWRKHSLPLMSALVGIWSTQCPGCFIPGKVPVHIVRESGWSPESVLTGVEILVATGIRSPERPTRSESLYRLRYPGPYIHTYI